MTDFPLIFVFIIQNVRISALNFAVKAHKYIIFDKIRQTNKNICDIFFYMYK